MIKNNTKPIPKIINTGVGTLISNGTTIVGDVQVNGNIKVEGTIKGTVNATGELIVINSGKIEGEIHVGSAIIAGLVKGNLNVEEKTVLANDSKLVGDLKTKNLVIEEGAKLQGNCSMNVEESAAKKPE